MSMIRFVCKTHGVRLKNCGNGRFLFPTACLDPIVDKDGWMEIDLSEFFCPGTYDAEDNSIEAEIERCEWTVEFESGSRISDRTQLTDSGWKFEEEKA